MGASKGRAHNREMCPEEQKILPTEKIDVLKEAHSMKDCIYLSKQKITVDNNWSLFTKH